MTSALAYKEFRETVGIAAVALAAMLLMATSHMGWRILPDFLQTRAYASVPFLNDSFSFQFGVLALLLATVLGLRQSLGDFLGDAYLFLLHRPLSRRHLYGTKLAVGLATYAVCAVAPVLLYMWWASLPGTHASPFDLAMTTPVWLLLAAMTTVYLGAFLAGIRPANWFGSRLAPLVAASGFILPVAMLPWTGVSLVVLLLADALLVYLILKVAERRDFPG